MKGKYIKTRVQNIVNISKIVTIHYYEYDQKFTFPGEVHDFWEVVYIDKGVVEIQSEEERFSLKQGDIIFHQPNEFHSIRSLNSSPDFFVISFVCDSPIMQYFIKYRSHLNKEFRPFIISIIKEALNTYNIQDNNPKALGLVKKDDYPIGADQLIKTYLEQFLIYLVRDITAKGTPGIFPSKESLESHLVQEIKKYLKEQTTTTIRVNDICNKFGYSKSYLSNLFHQQCGESLANYMTKQKIARAKQLIREENLNFAQISSMLDFDNPQYFSRVFKRVTGMSPTEFKHSLEFKQ